jgi:thiol:disulfide interchange protein DsbD
MRKWLYLVLLCCIISPLQAKPLPAAQVFQVKVETLDPNSFTIQWQIKPDYFLYRDRIKITASKDSNVQLAPLRLPNAIQKTDKQGKPFAVYQNQLTLPVGLLANKPGETLLKLGYQGCSQSGFCYPPIEKQIQVTIDNHLNLAAVSLEDSPLPATTLQEQEGIHSPLENIFTQHNKPMVLLLFFGFGLLLSFTPCILPMVPVLSSIIVGHGKEMTTKKSFFLSLSYVLSMSLTYALVGAIAALLGANLQISMQSPTAISLFSLLFVLLALSMFGFYEFKLPTAWQEKIAGPEAADRGGHYLGAAIMGCLSTLILSPCVTAPLIGVLTYIAQTKNILFGSLTLFVLSLGMGTPLLLIGTSAGRFLPEAGSWMEAIKVFFGFLMLAVAFFLMSRVLPPSFSMMLWAAFLIFSGIYAGALRGGISGWDKFFQGIGIILLGYGLLILIGSSMGSVNPWQPLKSVYAKALVQQNTQARTFTLPELKTALMEARGKPLLLDFYADWCASCAVMEATTLQDPAVQNALAAFTTIRVDVTANTAQNQAILAYFHVVAPPTFLFFNAEGEALPAKTLVGEVDAATFLQQLKSEK